MYSSFSMQCTLLLYVMYSILSPFHVLFFLYVMYSSFSISCTQFFLHDPIRNNKFLFPEYYYRYSLNITIDSNVSGDSLYFKILLSWLWPLNPIKVGGSESMHNVERRAPWKKVLLPESNCLRVAKQTHSHIVQG